MNLRLPSLLLSFCLVVGCQNNKSKQSSAQPENTIEKKEQKVVEINFDKASSISDGISLVSTISFDENVSNIIGSIQQMVVRGDTIFAVDPIKNPGVYAYHKDGSQIFAYCEDGNGPEDVSSPMSLSVTDNWITVYDFASKKLFYFSKDGQYLRSISLPLEAISAMSDPEDGLWLDYSNQKYENVKLAWTKDSIENKTCILSVPEHLKGMTTMQLNTFAMAEDGSLRYYPSLEPRIYCLDKGNAYVAYELDFKGKWPSDEEIKEKYLGDGWASKFIKFPIHSQGYAESNQWLVLGLRYKDALYIAAYDKQNGDTDIYIDEDDKYLSPLYVEGSYLYLHCQDDTIDILNLADKKK